MRDCTRDTSRPRPDVDHARPLAWCGRRQKSERKFDEELGFGPRNQDVRRQAEALVGALSAWRSPAAASDTLVVAGDFNTWGGREPAIQLLDRTYPDAPAAIDQATWRGPLGMHATLDHVFTLRGPARSIDVRRLQSRFGSDHYPLLLTIRF